MSTIATVGTAKSATARSRWLTSARRLKNLGLLAVVLLLWQVTSTYILDKTTAVLLPPPSAIAYAGWDLIRSGDLFVHLSDSLRRELVAFIWATSAIPLAIAMGWSKTINDQVDPLIEVLRPVPPLAWIPLSILWFGIGDVQNQFIIFLGMFFPILLNTIAGVKNIEPNIIRAARCLGAQRGAHPSPHCTACGAPANHHRYSDRSRRWLDGIGGSRAGWSQFRSWFFD